MIKSEDYYIHSNELTKFVLENWDGWWQICQFCLKKESKDLLMLMILRIFIICVDLKNKDKYFRLMKQLDQIYEYPYKE